MLTSFKNFTQPVNEELDEDRLITEATHEDMIRSLSSLIKHNNGLFKSERQGFFLRNQGWRTSENEDGVNHMRSIGVPVDLNKHTEVGHFTQFHNFNPYSAEGARAGRGGRTSHHVYLMDKHGVVAAYKLGQTQHQFDPKKTQKVWERPADAVTSGNEHHVEEDPHMVSKHLGKVGDKITHDVTVVRLHNLGPSRFAPAYTRAPDQYMTVMKTDEGHIIHHYGTPPASLRGYRTGDDWKGTVTGEVKKHHIDRNGNHVTILTRPKFTRTNTPAKENPKFPGEGDTAVADTGGLHGFPVR